MSIKKNSKGFTLIELERSKRVRQNDGFTLIELERSKRVRQNEGFTLIELERSKRAKKINLLLPPSLRLGSVRQNEGFTLIELLAVTAIITILTAAILLNYKNSEQQFALQRSANKLAQDIRRAGEMAMSAQECVGCPQLIPPRYGLYVTQPGGNLYRFFADINDNGLFNVGPDVTIQPFEYEKGITNQQVSGIGCSGPIPGAQGQQRVHITFKPPSPSIEIWVGWASPVSCSEITLTLEVSGNPGLTKSVKINKVGMIEVQ